MEIFILISGIIVLLLTLYDFFFTTLSGGGAAPLTRMISFAGHRILYSGVKLFGRNVFRFSGMAINLMLLLVWILLIWAGLFLIFTSHPEAITNDIGRPANNWERLYFTGYILSTLGIGNFLPRTSVFEFLTSIFSFFGFIFFTTSMTYLISVSSGVIHKRSLALAIRNLGKTPEEMVYRLLNQDITLSRLNLALLQQKIEKHIVNLQAYPVLHYYANSKTDGSLNLNIVALDEAISILSNSKEGEKIKNALTAIRSSLNYFLNHIEENFLRNPSRMKAPDFQKLPGWEIANSAYLNDPTVHSRRKILGSLLRTENIEWQEVYQTRTSFEQV